MEIKIDLSEENIENLTENDLLYFFRIKNEKDYINKRNIINNLTQDTIDKISKILVDFINWKIWTKDSIKELGSAYGLLISKY